MKKPLLSLLVGLAAVAGVLAAPSAAQAVPASTYVAGAVPDAQKVQTEYGVPASVTIAQSALESAWGGSDLTTNYNNYFGYKCVGGEPGTIAISCKAYPTQECTPTCHTETGNFRVYANRRDSFRDYGRLLSTLDRYSAAFRYTDDPDQFIREIKKGGYATDPDYVDKIISIMRTYDLYQYNDGSQCSAPATVYGVIGNSTLTVTKLADPVTGGARIFGAQQIATLPFTVKALVALDYNTLFATDGANLHKIEVINFSGHSTSVTTSVVSRGGWTHRLLAYDGHGHLFGVTNALRRYDLSSSYGIVSNTLVSDSGWTSVRTISGAGKDRMIATIDTGELVGYRVTDTVRRESLRPKTWTFRNLVSPGGGVYYAQSEDGALSHYLDRNPADGDGADISRAKPIDANGWTQRLLTAQPKVCV